MPITYPKGKEDILNGDYLNKMDPDTGYRRSSFHPGMAAMASRRTTLDARTEGEEGLPHMVAPDSYQDPQHSPAPGHLSYYG